MKELEPSAVEYKITNDVKKDAILYNGEIFTYLDSGLTRNVFVNESKTLVIKQLIFKDGFDFNEEEFNIYESADNEKKQKLAKTKLTHNGLFIEQEYCSPIENDDRPLTIGQILFASSCRDEVGWTLGGNLVCYDLDEYKKY